MSSFGSELKILYNNSIEKQTTDLINKLIKIIDESQTKIIKKAMRGKKSCTLYKVPYSESNDILLRSVTDRLNYEHYKDLCYEFEHTLNLFLTRSCRIFISWT